MKIEITAGGIYGKEGKPVPIGTEMTVKEEPKGWAGRYRVIGKSESKAAVTNPKAGSEPAKSAVELLEMAKDESVHHATFKSEATKLLGEDTPSKKDEIIAKLEELATKPE